MEREVFGAAMDALRDLEERYWETAMRVASVTAEGLVSGKKASEAFEDALFYVLDTEGEEIAFEEFHGCVMRAIEDFESSDE